MSGYKAVLRQYPRPTVIAKTEDVEIAHLADEPEKTLCGKPMPGAKTFVRYVKICNACERAEHGEPRRKRLT